MSLFNQIKVNQEEPPSFSYNLLKTGSKAPANELQNFLSVNHFLKDDAQNLPMEDPISAQHRQHLENPVQLNDFSNYQEEVQHERRLRMKKEVIQRYKALKNQGKFLEYNRLREEHPFRAHEEEFLRKTQRVLSEVNNIKEYIERVKEAIYNELNSYSDKTANLMKYVKDKLEGYVKEKSCSEEQGSSEIKGFIAEYTSQVGEFEKTIYNYQMGIKLLEGHLPKDQHKYKVIHHIPLFAKHREDELPLNPLKNREERQINVKFQPELKIPRLEHRQLELIDSNCDWILGLYSDEIKKSYFYLVEKDKQIQELMAINQKVPYIIVHEGRVVLGTEIYDITCQPIKKMSDLLCDRSPRSALADGHNLIVADPNYSHIWVYTWINDQYQRMFRFKHPLYDFYTKTTAGPIQINRLKAGTYLISVRKHLVCIDPWMKIKRLCEKSENPEEFLTPSKIRTYKGYIQEDADGDLVIKTQQSILDYHQATDNAHIILLTEKNIELWDRLSKTKVGIYPRVLSQILELIPNFDVNCKPLALTKEIGQLFGPPQLQDIANSGITTLIEIEGLSVNFEDIKYVGMIRRQSDDDSQLRIICLIKGEIYILKSNDFT